jgi:hypothetical protein
LPPTLADWIEKKQSLDTFSPEVIEKVAIMLCVDPKNLLNTEDEFRDLLLQDGYIYAAVSIAAGMKEYLGDFVWLEIESANPIELQKRIEGVLTKEQLKEHLVFINGEVSTEAAEKTKRFLFDWIDNANDESLRCFVRAIAGKNTLSNELLYIKFYNRGPEIIPGSHTCSFTLELSSDYPNKKTFNEKLAILLTEGLAGEGFQNK